MSEKETVFSELQERHLDLMIKLAFDQEDAEEIQQILDEANTASIPQEDEMSKRAWIRAQAKMYDIDKTEQRAKRLAGVKQSIPRVLEVAACLIVVFSIAMPIAIASSAEFRARVMQLLVNIDTAQNEAHFEFVENTDASFTVPEGWTGDYFMSYIPNGMVESWHSERVTTIEYVDEAGSGLAFSEYLENSSVSVGTENATISYTDINGTNACVIDGYSQSSAAHMVTIVWSNDAKWFKIDCSNMKYTEALDVAKGVRKILK